MLRTHVTAAALTPTVLASLDRGRLDEVGTLITSGEVCPAELVAAWAPGPRMFNAYGPTETTVWATCIAAVGGAAGESAPRSRGCARWCWMPG